METAGSDPPTRRERLTDGIDWKQSAIYGGAAWLVGYVLSYAIVTVAGATPNGGDASEVAMLAYFEGTGGLYDMNAPPMNVSGMITEGTGTLFVYSTLDTKFWGLGVFLHYLLPPIVLVVAGYMLAGEYVDAAADDSFEGRLEAWVGGASLVAAFGGLTVLGIFLLGPSGGDPEGLRVLLAAIVYPTVFAGLGAARRVGFRIRSLRATGQGLLAFVLAAVLWNVLEDPFGGAIDFGDLSGADQYLAYFGVFLSDHGAYVTPGQVPGSGSSMTSGTDMGIVGSVDPVLVLLLGPAIVAGAVVYRNDVRDPIAGVGVGARLSLGYVLGVALLTVAVLAQRMNWQYDQLYGTGTDQQVREQLYQLANEMFGALLPQVVLVAGVLWPVVFAAAGGAAGAKVVESQVADETPAPAAAAGEDD